MYTEINESAVEFDTSSRIHMGLAVRNIEASIAFYQVLFGQKPTKTRPGYAKFEVAQPSVNLSLNQVGGETGPNNPVAHFGIQVKSTAAVQDVATRLAAAGMETKFEEQVTCCYAVQNKVWSADPDGNKWEVYVVLDNSPQQHHSSHGECCHRDLADVKLSASTLAEIRDVINKIPPTALPEAWKHLSRVLENPTTDCCPAISEVMQAVDAGNLAAAKAAFTRAGGNSACDCLTKSAT